MLSGIFILELMKEIIVVDDFDVVNIEEDEEEEF